MKVEVFILDTLTGNRATYRPPFDYATDEDASGGWEFSNDMCDANRLDHIADCNGAPRDDDHTCGEDRCFVKIVEIGTGRVVYEEDGWVEPTGTSHHA